MKARDLMTSNVRTARADMTLPELDRLLLDAGVGGLPVVEGKKVVGVVSRSDILRQARVGHTIAEYAVNDFYRDISGFGGGTNTNDAESRAQIEQLVGEHFVETTVAEAMNTEVISVSPDASVRDVAKVIAEKGIHRVLVLEDDRLVGVITATDIVRLVAEGRSLA